MRGLTLIAMITVLICLLAAPFGSALDETDPDPRTNADEIEKQQEELDSLGNQLLLTWILVTVLIAVVIALVGYILLRKKPMSEEEFRAEMEAFIEGKDD